MTMIRVALPFHLATLSRTSGEITLDVPSPVTRAAILDALEEKYPMLRGTIRDHVTKKRRAFLRFFACNQDLSDRPADEPLPESVACGSEPFLCGGAIAGG
jgi:hypothetical protein